MNNREYKNYPRPKTEYKVLVRCFTFNQSKYIEAALNGFAMQQTNFPFVCLVMDDASTDGEQEVIKAWMERECDMDKVETFDISTSIVIIVPHKTNSSCTFAFYLLKQNLYGTGKKIYYLKPWREKCTYETICEGDDYWTNPSKLQLQVDFMESHIEYGMCYGQVVTFKEEEANFSKKWGGDYETFDQFMKTNVVPTLTVLFRVDLDMRYQLQISPNSRQWKMGDYPRWIWFAHESKVKYMPVVFGVYRVLRDSASHSRNFERTEQFIKSGFEIRKFFAEYFNRYDCYSEDAMLYNLLSEAYKYKNKEGVKNYFNRLNKKKLKAYMKLFISMFFSKRP